MKILPPIRNPLYWLTLSFCIAGIACLFVSIELMTQAGLRISPIGSLQEKTILLFQWLKIALPIAGLVMIGWICTPGYRRDRLMQSFREHVVYSVWVMPAILVLAFLLRFGWMLYYPTQPYAESRWYFQKAADLINGRGYIYDSISHKPTAAYPVGYPAFLALIFLITGPSMVVAKLANVALGVLVVYLTYVLAQRLFDQMIAVFSAFFMAILPGLVVYSSLMDSDVLFLALVTAVAALSLPKEAETASRDKNILLLALFTGILNGCLMLTRSTGLVLLPLWILFRWIVLPHNLAAVWRWALALTVATILVVLPWTIRNYVYFHKLIPISNNGGANFWIGNNPYASGGFFFPRDARNPLLPLIGDEIAVDETAYRLGMAFVRANPGRTIRLLPAKVFYLYNSNDSGVDWNIRSAVSRGQPGTEVDVWVLTNFVYTVLVLLAVLGLLALPLRGMAARPIAWIGLMFVVYWTLAHLPFFGSDRFMLPSLPFLMIYAAVGLSSALEFDRKGEQPYIIEKRMDM